MDDVRAGLVLEGYEFLEPVGEGGYASVFKVRSIQFNRMFVAKVVRVRNMNIDRAWKSFDAEIQALLLLDHPNIIKLYAHFRYQTNFILILEHCPNGSLEDFIREHGPVRGQMVLEILRSVCSALRYAWSRGVHHRDIKPANMLVDGCGRCKLVDFGISLIRNQKEEQSNEVTDFRCSPVCAAPEIVNRLAHDPIKSDIWALGVTVLWLSRGAIPWDCNNYDDLLEKIREGDYVVPNEMDPRVVKIVEQMLVVFPESRELPSEEDLGEIFKGAHPIRRERTDAFPCHSFMLPAHARFQTSAHVQAERVFRRNSVCIAVLKFPAANRSKGRLSVPIKVPDEVKNKQRGQAQRENQSRVVCEEDGI